MTVVDSVTSASPTLAGFERRALNHAGSASYITRADIVAKRPAQTIDLLRRITSVKIIDSAGVLIAVSRRFDKPVVTGPDLDMAPCPLRVVVDGHLREWGFAVNAPHPRRDSRDRGVPWPRNHPGGVREHLAGCELRTRRYLDSPRQVEATEPNGRLGVRS